MKLAILTILGLLSSGMAAPVRGVQEERLVSRSLEDLVQRSIESAPDLWARDNLQAEIELSERDLEDGNAMQLIERAPAKPMPKMRMMPMGRGGGLGEALGNVASAIMAVISENKERRDRFAAEVVSELHKKDPKWNYVACAVQHKQKFEGQQGKDWAHTHREFQYNMGGTKGYEIYQFKKGEFWREGDGGNLNWAYMGNLKVRDGDQGRHLVFNAP